jgi:hypothetical protein
MPATTIPSGGDLDWKSRPGRYMDAQSTLTLSLETVVSRCRLTVSKPVLKAPMVSALDTLM